MKRLLILVLSICVLLITQVSAGAGGLSCGIPLPFPFLFYNFGPKHCPEPGCDQGYNKDLGYSKDYHYYQPGCNGPGCCHEQWYYPRGQCYYPPACRAIVIPGV
jgi:hypothetical protein